VLVTLQPSSSGMFCDAGVTGRLPDHPPRKWHAAAVLPRGRPDLEAGLRGWRATCERMQRTRIPTRSSPRRGRAQVRADTLRHDGRRRLRPFVSHRGSTPASTTAGPADIFQTPTRTPLHELEIKRPGSCSTTRAVPFQQRTNTVAGRYRCGHGYFTVDVSVFWAHLLRSPSSVETGKLYVGAFAAFWPLQFRPSGRSPVVISF
jgi:hypothetical protein